MVAGAGVAAVGVEVGAAGVALGLEVKSGPVLVPEGLVSAVATSGPAAVAVLEPVLELVDAVVEPV